MTWRRLAWTLLPLSAGLVVAIAAILRQRGVPKMATIWAEDGRVFAQCLYDAPASSCLVEPYQGYLHTIPRIGATLALSGPPETLSTSLSIAAAIVAGLAAWAAGRAVRDVTTSPLAGLFAGASLGLVFQAGREVLGNLTNLHWVLFGASVVVIVCSWLGRRVGFGDLILVALTAVTSALAPLLPALAVGGVVARTRGSMVTLSVAAAASAIQIAVMVTSTRETTARPDLTIADAVSGIVDLVVTTGWFGGAGRVLDPLVPVVAIVVVVALIALASGRVAGGVTYAQEPDVERRPPPWSVVAAVVTLAAIGVGSYAASVALNGVINPRYGYLAAALIATAIGLGLGSLWHALGEGHDRPPLASTAGRAVSVGAVAVAILFGVGYLASFRLDARASSGPDVRDQMHAADVACAAGTDRARILISPLREPPVWWFDVPCTAFD